METWGFSLSKTKIQTGTTGISHSTERALRELQPKKISELVLISLELIFISQLREWARGELFCLLGPGMKVQDVFALLACPFLTWLEAAAGKPRDSLVLAELGVSCSCSQHQQAPVYMENQAVIASTHCRQHGRGTGAACRVTGSLLTPLFGDAP